MAVEIVEPMELPTEEKRLRIARTTAMCWWSDGAIMAISPQMTMAPPANAMKICVMTMKPTDLPGWRK